MQDSSSSHQDLVDIKSHARLLMKLIPGSLGASRQEFASVFSHSRAGVIGSEQATALYLNHWAAALPCKGIAFAEIKQAGQLNW